MTATQQSGVTEDAFDRVRAAALDELRRAPHVPSWRRQAAVVAGVTAGLGVFAALGTALAGVYDWSRLGVRAPILLGAVAVAMLDGVGALVPARRPVVLAGLGASLLMMAALVATRAPGGGSATPGWVCSVSHLGMDLFPAAVALWGLRQAAWTWPRALTAGLGAGTVGAVMGELACQKGRAHVLIHHVGAWVPIAIACVLVSRALRPRSFAP